MKWIKASERLPKKPGQYVIRDLKNQRKKVTNYGYSKNSLLMYNPNLYEWLCEEPEEAYVYEKHFNGGILDLDLYLTQNNIKVNNIISIQKHFLSNTYVMFYYK